MVIGYDDKGLPKTKNVLAKTKSECVEKLKTLKLSLIHIYTRVRTSLDWWRPMTL